MAKKPNIDVELVRALAALLKDSDLAEIEIEDEDTRIRLARQSSYAPMALAPPPAQSAAPAPAAPAASVESAPASPVAISGDEIPSPMVGTAYLAPSPDASPFVEVGQQVKKGQTIVIIEAMKTMNQIAAPRDGEIASIDVKDGQPVEFGETLLRLV